MEKHEFSVPFLEHPEDAHDPEKLKAAQEKAAGKFIYAEGGQAEVLTEEGEALFREQNKRDALEAEEKGIETAKAKVLVAELLESHQGPQYLLSFPASTGRGTGKYNLTIIDAETPDAAKEALMAAFQAHEVVRQGIERRATGDDEIFAAAREHNRNVMALESDGARKFLMEIAEEHPWTIFGLAKRSVGKLSDLE